MTEEHNHELRKEVFDSQNTSLSENEEGTLNLLSEGASKIGKIQRLMEKRFGKFLSTQKLRNLMNKLQVNLLTLLNN